MSAWNVSAPITLALLAISADGDIGRTCFTFLASSSLALVAWQEGKR